MSFRITLPLKQAIVTANPAPLPPSQDTQILSNTNGTNSFSYTGYNFRGSNMFPENTVDISAFSYVDSATGKFAGGVLGPNGNIYCIPFSANYAAIINPYTKTVDRTTLSNLLDGNSSAKWYGGVVAPNGKIYCIPHNSSNMLIINTVNNSTSYITGITVDNYPTIGANNDQKWIGGVLAPNGKIYCAPYMAQCVLIIDPVTDTINLTDISGVNRTKYTSLIWKTSNLESFGGGVLHPNGKIYFIPAAALGVLQIDPVTNAVDASSFIAPSSFIPSGSRFFYFGGCLGVDGNIYTAPWNGSRILKIDVTKDVSSQQFTSIPTDISLTTGGRKWQGMVSSTNGKIYGIPFDSSSSVIIDPFTTFASQTTITNLSSSIFKYSGGVLGPDGVIYCIPRDASTIMTIKTGIPSLQPWMLGPAFNKF